MTINPGGPISLGQAFGTDLPTNLRPDQCLIRLVDDVVVCLREIGPHHPAHDPKAPIGATRTNLITALEKAQREERS